MKYFIIAGEASGDLHGSNLILALRQLDSESTFEFWGGDRMATAAGKAPLRHIADLSFMGVWEVLKNLRTISRHFKECKRDISVFEPDALILIDYPGFNLKLSAWAKQNGYNVQYYISPKLWAWNKGRIKALRAHVNHLYTILPFETAFYKDQNLPTTYVGNPLVEQITAFKNRHNSPSPAQPPIIALLPGSRRQEVRRILPVMLDVVCRFPDYSFVIAGIHTIPEKLYREILQTHPYGEKVQLVFDATYEILSKAKMGLITSGTSTLEAALFGLPQVVCYKTSPLTYVLAKLFVKIKFISLVNLIMDASVVTELIQGQLNADNLEEEMHRLLHPEHIHKLKTDYVVLYEKLGTQSASREVAKGVVRSIALSSNE